MNCFMDRLAYTSQRYIYTDHRYKYTLEKNRKMRKIMTRCTNDRPAAASSQAASKIVWAYWTPGG